MYPRNVVSLHRKSATIIKQGVANLMIMMMSKILDTSSISPLFQYAKEKTFEII